MNGNEQPEVKNSEQENDKQWEIYLVPLLHY